MANLSGLIVTPGLTQSRVRSIEMHFEPSMGIMARKVDKLGLDIRSFKEPLKRSIRQVMIPSIAQNFTVGGRPPWYPLEDSTVNKKGSEKPLVTTGKLARNMTYMSIWHIDREKAFIADLPQRIWYGKVHQAGARFNIPATGFKIVHVSYLGTTLGRPDKGGGNVGEIPARPFVTVQQQDIEEIERVFELWLNERIVKAGL